MKAAKLIGERLVNYITDGVNWKDHKDIVLDYWMNYEARKDNINPRVLKGIYYVDELKEKHRDAYETWFKNFDFQSEDKRWIKFVDGTLNLFYKTSNPEELHAETWFVWLTNSELKAKEIVENQQFHGNPNINNFWQITQNGKYEEIAGRDNGYIFSDQLTNLSRKTAKNFVGGIIYQSPQSVELEYLDGKKTRKKCINWASHCENITLVKVSASGKLVLVPVVIANENRIIPDGKIKITPMDGTQMNNYLKNNYSSLFGEYNRDQELEKQENTGINARKNAINTMYDEEIEINKVVDNINEFVKDGNVDEETRLKNKERREEINKKKSERKRSIKRATRELDKQKAKDLKRKLEKFKGNLGINLNS